MLELDLAKEAENDLEEITTYTAETFGEEALDRYLHLLEVVFLQLRRDPSCAGVRQADGEIKKYHLAQSREAGRTETGVVRNPRHLIFFRESSGRLEILRVLHESMDFERHLPEH